MIESVSLRQMHHLYEVANYDVPFTEYGYVYVHVVPGQDNYVEVVRKAFRFNGMILFVVRSGKISFAVNMEHFQLGAHNLLIAGSNSIVTVEPDTIEDLDAYALFIGDELMHDLNFEISIINSLPITSRRSPLQHLTSEEVEHLAGYFELLDLNVRRNTNEAVRTFSKGISRSLLTSLFYQLVVLSSFRQKSVSQPEDSTSDVERPRTRRMLYTHEFVRLVQKHFRLEHSVGFYANKLCISSKYLSLVVKETTGRSAADIIDEFLLLEAKNLLRLSGKNIQQVAYELNFSNQSSFGKYFKNLTGMSPSEFQNS